MLPSFLVDTISGRKTAYITVKNADYIRTLQFKNILNSYASDSIIISSDKSGVYARVLDVKRQLRKADLSDVEVIIGGFLPQLIWKYIKHIAGRNNRKSKKEYKKEYKKEDLREDKREEDSLKEDKSGNVIIIADFFLSLYDTIVLDRRYIGKQNPIAGFLRSLDKKVLCEADYIITDTKADADFFVSEFMQDVKSSNCKYNIEPLYLEADSSIYNPYTSSISNKDCKKVLYFGTGLPLQGIDIVLGSYYLLARKYSNSNMELVFIGHCNKSFTYKSSEYSCIRILSWLTQQDLAKEIETSNVCLAGHFSKDDGKANRTIPGKAFIYEAMHKKMILGDSIANREIFCEDEYHHFVKRGDIDALVDGIEAFLGGIV